MNKYLIFFMLVQGSDKQAMSLTYGETFLEKDSTLLSYEDLQKLRSELAIEHKVTSKQIAFFNIYKFEKDQVIEAINEFKFIHSWGE